ncbi:MAG: hypothetical protein ACXWCY_26550 [Burkholderiales bacterium]
MTKTLTIAFSVTLALSAVGCSGMQSRDNGTIMRSVQGDPAGSANIGTGSVTVNSTVPDEAKAAGIGIGP